MGLAPGPSVAGRSRRTRRRREMGEITVKLSRRKKLAVGGDGRSGRRRRRCRVCPPAAGPDRSALGEHQGGRLRPARCSRRSCARTSLPRARCQSRLRRRRSPGTGTRTTSPTRRGSRRWYPRRSAATPRPEDRAGQEHLPRLDGQNGADPTTTTAPLPLPGPRDRLARLHHADQPRRRHRPPGDADRDPRRPGERRSPTIDGSTWDPWAQRLLFTTENAEAPTYRRPRATRRRSRTSPARSAAAATKASRTTRDGNIWIVEDIGGSTKPGTPREAPTASSTASCRAKPSDLTNGKLRSFRSIVADQPITFAIAGGARRVRPGRAPHLRHSFDTTLGHHP